MGILDGKAAVVTGGGRGIGRGHCLHLAEQGASVVVNDIDLDEARKVVAEIGEQGGKAAANDSNIVSGSVRFKAGALIRIGEGFSVAAGATFTAEVGPTVLGAAFLRDGTPSAVKDYYARFYIHPDNLTLTSDSDRFDHLVAYDAQGNREFVVGVTHHSGTGERRLFATAFADDGSPLSTAGLCEVALGSGWQYVETHWKASSGTDGDLELSVDGGAPQSLAQCLSLSEGVGNGSGEVSAVEWGAQGISTTGGLGVVDLDDFDSRANGPIGGL